MPLRLALGPMSEQWTGGLEYYRLLRAAFATLPEGERPITGLLTWDAEGDTSSPGDLADEPIVIGSGSTGMSLGRRALNKAGRMGLPVRTMTNTEKALRDWGADVLFGTQVFADARAIPFLGWIPDFQYVHVPEAFAKETVETRRRGAEAVAAAADVLLMSSEAVRTDLRRQCPWAVEKARVVHFVSPVPSAIYEKGPSWLCQHYHLPERFLYIPNQFWAHKNHHLVIEALQSEPARSAGVVVVCSGNPHDSRNPTFFGELLAAISTSGLRDRMIILGFVPRAHVLPLVRQSVALLQPSRFEGWNTAIEEAKSLGKSVLASDLPVHLEQDPPGGVYFRVDDAGDLSRAMVDVWTSRDPGPDAQLEAQARAALPGRMTAFARRFSEIAREAVARRR